MHKCVVIKNWQGYLSGCFRSTQGIANDGKIIRLWNAGEKEEQRIDGLPTLKDIREKKRA